MLFPGADKKLTDIDIKESVALAIGPEGDFTEQEIETLTEFGFVPVTIGNRILRAETATIAAISALRYGKKRILKITEKDDEVRCGNGSNRNYQF